MALEGQQLDRYRIIRLLGSGGMGDVYLAEDARIGQQVAIKVVRAEENLFDEAVRLFKREAQAIVALDHPHILPLYNYGEEKIGDMPLVYLVMPYRREGSLAKWAYENSRNGLHSPQDIVHFVLQAADALQHAHDNQIIHRDVKLSNFLLRERKADPAHPDILLADFGIARLATMTAGVSRAIRGTPTYMAPEHWKGKSVPATDQYALAIMIYELLTGRPPFRGSPGEIMYQHLTVSPPPPSQLNTTLPKEIDMVLLTALAKEPEERFASISAFAKAFQFAASAENVTNTARTDHAENIAPAKDTIHLSNVDHGVNRVQVQDGAPGPTVAAGISSEVKKSSSSSTLSALPENHKFLWSPKKNLRTGRWGVRTLVLLGISALLILSGIGVGAYQNYSAMISTDATRTAKQAETAQANATASEIPPVLATIQANATVTTVAGTATVIASNPYPSYLPGHGKLALYDPLSEADSEWSPESGAGTSAGDECQFMKGAYHISQTQKGYFYDCFSSSSFKDFAFEVQMTIVKGDCGGILFRSSGGNSYYFFEICQDGTFKLLNYPGTSGNDALTLLPSSRDSAIKTNLNQSNRLAVIAQKSAIVLFVNGKQIANLQDSSYSEGQFGLFADDYTNNTEVAFSQLKAWKI